MCVPFFPRIASNATGQDEGARKAGLRLDLRESALKGGKSGEKAIVPGKPGASALVSRIFSTDEDELMPPAKISIPSPRRKRSSSKRWITAGAEYKPHWAFAPPRQVSPPSVRDAHFKIRNPIDAFVLARLQKEKLSPLARSRPLYPLPPALP